MIPNLRSLMHVALLVVTTLVGGMAHAEYKIELFRDLNVEPVFTDRSQSTSKTVNGNLIFTQNSPEYGNELWVSEQGTESAHILKDICPGLCSGLHESFLSVVWNDILIFTARDGQHLGIYRSDGTSENTRKIIDLADSSTSISWSLNGAPAALRDAAILSFTDFLTRTVLLWRTDGTTAGTYMLGSFTTQPGDIVRFVSAPGGTGVLHKSRDKSFTCTTGNTLGTPFFRYSDWGWLDGVFNSQVVFRTYSSDGYRVYISDCAQVNELGPYPATPKILGFVEGKLIFGHDAANGVPARVYASNGVAAGTSVIFSNPTATLSVFGRLPWIGPLWASDQITPSALALFAANQGSQSSIYVTAGTTDTTQLISSNVTSNLLYGRTIYGEGNRLVVIDNWNTLNKGVWFTNGTAPFQGFVTGIANAKYLGNIAGRSILSGFYNNLTSLFLQGGDGAFEIGPRISDSTSHEAVGSRYVFAGKDSSQGTELWTASPSQNYWNASLVKDIAPGIESSNPRWFVGRPDGRYLFSANSDANTQKLWISDGTAAGTKAIRNESPDTLLFNRGSGAEVRGSNGQYGFFLDRGKLWRTNGSATGTSVLLDNASQTLPHLDQNTLYAYGRISADPQERKGRLWKGTASGLTPQPKVFDSEPNFRGVTPHGPVYSTYAPNGTSRTMVTDGTEAGTGVLLEQNTPSFSLGTVYQVGNLPFYQQGSNSKLWVTDGTPQNTQIVRDTPVRRIARCFDRPELLVTFGDAGGDTLWRIRVNGSAWQITQIQSSYASEFNTSASGCLGGDPWYEKNSSVYRINSASGQRIHIGDLPLSYTLNLDGSDQSLGTSPIREAIEFGDKVLLAANDRYYKKLFTSDGSSNSLQVIFEIPEVAASSRISCFTVWDGRAFFVGRSRATGAEVYVTDGTAAGTRMITDLNPGPDNGAGFAWSYSPMVPTSHALLFSGNDGAHGNELFAVRSVAVDECPDDPIKISPGQCGCGIPDTDRDGDGTPDCIDQCSSDATKIAPGACGCGTPDTDSDGDGVMNCLDGCVSDPTKTAPGVCGCGIPDTDSDLDGSPNCVDLCPNDPAKTAPGQCGCGMPDRDSDGDRVLDCQDLCPNDPRKVMPETCGCGVEERVINGVIVCGDPTTPTATPSATATARPTVTPTATPTPTATAGGTPPPGGPEIQSITPRKPQVAILGRKMIITMERRAPYEYIVTVKAIAAKKAKRAKKWILAGSSYQLLTPKLPKGSYSVTYAFKDGRAAVLSRTSPTVRIKIK